MGSLLAVFTWRKWQQTLMDRIGWTWTTSNRSDVTSMSSLPHFLLPVQCFLLNVLLIWLWTMKSCLKCDPCGEKKKKKNIVEFLVVIPLLGCDWPGSRCNCQMCDVSLLPSRLCSPVCCCKSQETFSSTWRHAALLTCLLTVMLGRRMPFHIFLHVTSEPKKRCVFYL